MSDLMLSFDSAINAEGAPQRCVVIEKNKASKPPDYTIPRNDNSVRAYSKRNRIYVLRDFLLRNFPASLTPRSTILDVAGGRGDLSWILRNIDGIDAIIADPRVPNHRSLLKSVTFLVDHPEEANVRAVEGLPTYQPLAKLLPRILANSAASAAARGTGQRSDDQDLRIFSPKFMRIHVDNTLVEALRKFLSSSGSAVDLRDWDAYWQAERCKVESNKVYYGGTLPTKNTTGTIIDGEGCGQIAGARMALRAFQSLDLIVGFHPDQATEATIDLALLLKVPFAVVPCCVFPKEFPGRTLNGQRVRAHNELVEYLCRKHDKIRTEKLPFVETDTAKNVVLYMLKEDFEMQWLNSRHDEVE
ncbi:hypothetical protein ACHAXT_006703 [Thalassiosira profunda]